MLRVFSYQLQVAFLSLLRHAISFVTSLLPTFPFPPIVVSQHPPSSTDRTLPHSSDSWLLPQQEAEKVIWSTSSTSLVLLLPVVLTVSFSLLQVQSSLHLITLLSGPLPLLA